MAYYNYKQDAFKILKESSDLAVYDNKHVNAIFEDINSPATNNYLEKLYSSVIDKSHVDFGDIPNSRGNIEKYSGYASMNEILDTLEVFAREKKSSSLANYIKIVKDSISYLKINSSRYQKGYLAKNDIIITEYNIIVYTVIQAVSTLLYEFVDYIKRPDQDTVEIVLKDTKYKANLFYIQQLEKYNKINSNMKYAEYLDGILANGREAFTGIEAIGLGAVVAVALAIVPITREVIYQIYNIRSKISDCLAQQAYFLEMNKSIVEANKEFNAAKKKNILMRQEKVRNTFLRLSDKLRVAAVDADIKSKTMLKNDNRRLTIDVAKQQSDNDTLSLL